MSSTTPEPTEGITSIRYYDCGHCFNQLSHAYSGHPKERRRFPAGVFLLRHATEGLILFDTGYSQAIYQLGITGWLYRKLNPTTIEPTQEIATQLAVDGIATDEVRYVILSHLHPDHIGGVQFFPNAQFLLSRSAYDVLENPRRADLVFSKMLPEWFSSRLQLLDTFTIDEHTVLASMRPFDDDILVLVDLPGHAKGQIGAYIPERVLLAADACWGSDLVDYATKMTPVAKLIQHDYQAYLDTLDKVRQLQLRGIKIYYSHETYDAKELLS